jgi:hypothetical protein
MRNGETLTPRGKGDRVPTPKSNDSGDNECYQTVPSVSSKE